MKNNTEYKEILLLIYLKDYKDDYLYSEMKELLNLTLKQLKNFLKSLETKEIIEINECNDIILTKKGWDILKEEGWEDLAFTSLINKNLPNIFDKEKISQDDLYIPKKFKV